MNTCRKPQKPADSIAENRAFESVKKTRNYSFTQKCRFWCITVELDNDRYMRRLTSQRICDRQMTIANMFIP